MQKSGKVPSLPLRESKLEPCLLLKLSASGAGPKRDRKEKFREGRGGQRGKREIALGSSPRPVGGVKAELSTAWKELLSCAASQIQRMV